MTVLNIVEITSWIVGIISGVGGIIISFITMIKATNIERSIQKEKIDNGFKLDYDGLQKNLNICFSQMSSGDINNTNIYATIMKSLCKMKDYAETGGKNGEWSKKDISSIKKCQKIYKKARNITKENLSELTTKLGEMISLLEMKGNIYDIR